ncbi:MAG: YhbY family RNA-binding protein [Nanoarchaeota archaeon]
MVVPQIELQLGKNGLTPEFIANIEAKLGKLRNAVIKIKVLRSVRQNKADVKKYADELVAKLGPNYTVRTMGFTISLRRWRKPRE